MDGPPRRQSFTPLFRSPERRLTGGRTHTDVQIILLLASSSAHCVRLIPTVSTVGRFFSFHQSVQIHKNLPRRKQLTLVLAAKSTEPNRKWMP
ncbi:hypothetical protein M404DRAFT_1007806 [Pisolithus tinctorius Marx 270]|uniref:Uncharacterized protein n=1 Tax=Pisolithus tinctorius Marx 270 TaxID=870435 RepID=A0A0C3IDG5_PISTI|nr:hypothetical protein M404DRAFT_1007806 [Pisolithus tinctorius Marx 270]